MFLSIFSLLPFSLAEVCYNDIFLHRINTLLPSSGPFCLTSYQETNYKYPTLNEDQIIKLSKSKPQKQNNPVLHQIHESFILPVQLPAALIGELCSSFQLVEIGRNLSSECSLVIGQNNCPGFSAASFFDNLVSFNQNETYQLPLKLANGTEFLTASWSNGSCRNIFQEAELRLFMNKTILSAASLRLLYSPPIVGIVNQKYRILFVDNLDGLEILVEPVDERVYGVQSGIRGPIELPSLGVCNGNSRSSIKFKQNLSTGCSLRVDSCDDAQSKMRAFMDRFLPTHIARNSSSDPIPIIRIDGSQPTASTCTLPIVFHFEIFYSKFGITSNYKEEPVGLYITHQMAGLNIHGNFTVPLMFNIRFTDVTQEPTPFFSGLPYIDLRLPADAFYPFIRNSSPTRSFLLLVLFFYILG